MSGVNSNSKETTNRMDNGGEIKPGEKQGQQVEVKDPGAKNREDASQVRRSIRQGTISQPSINTSDSSRRKRRPTIALPSTVASKGAPNDDHPSGGQSTEKKTIAAAEADKPNKQGEDSGSALAKEVNVAERDGKATTLGENLNEAVRKN